MPYYLNRRDGTSLVTVEDGTVDSTTTSLNLVGKNFPTYGQFLNQNLIYLLENFANTSAPETSLTGQLWYDSSNKVIKFFREGSTTNYYQKLAVTTESATAPADARLGDLWWDTANSQLKLYDTATTSWRTIGPQTTNDGQLRVIGNNTFTLQVGGNNALNVDLYGALSLPYNPLFAGYDNTAETDQTTAGVEAYNTWKPKYYTDRGTNFDVTTGIFTVRTSGAYQVYVHVTTLGGPNAIEENEIRLRWLKNGSEVNINASNNHLDVANDGSNQQLVCSGIIECIQGDTIQLAFSTAIDAYISWQNSSYSIRFVG